MSYVGQSIQRVDAVGKVTGETRYPGDINLPGQAYMKILFANRPHAMIRFMFHPCGGPSARRHGPAAIKVRPARL